MTDDEWATYVQICRSYDRPSFKGEELFRELFETDNDGIIMFVRPPSNRHISMEVFMFVSALMNHQHIRLMHKKVDNLCNELRDKVSKIIESKSQQ